MKTVMWGEGGDKAQTNIRLCQLAQSVTRFGHLGMGPGAITQNHSQQVEGFVWLPGEQLTRLLLAPQPEQKETGSSGRWGFGAAPPGQVHDAGQRPRQRRGFPPGMTCFTFPAVLGRDVKSQAVSVTPPVCLSDRPSTGDLSAGSKNHGFWETRFVRGPQAQLHVVIL